MIRFIFYIVVCCVTSISISQRANPDTLLIKKIEKSLLDVQPYFRSNLDSALILLDKLERDIDRVNDPNMKAKYLLARAQFLLYKKEYRSIIDILRPSIKNSDKIDPLLLGKTFKDIGHAYKLEWVADSALVNYIKALKLFEQVQNNREISLTYLALGLVYSKMENKRLATDFYEKSIAYSANSEIMERHKEMITNQEIRPVSLDKTLELSLDIIKIAEDRRDDRLLVVAYSDAKKNYFALKNYNKALEFAEKELTVRKRSSFDSSIPNTKHFMGTIYAIQNKHKLAIDQFTEALPGATDSLKLSIYQGMKNVYRSQGNLQKAMEAMELFSALKDSINLRRVDVSLAEITAQYQTEIQEEQIKNLSIENELSAEKISRQRLSLFGTISGSALILVLGFLGYKNYRAKQELNYTQLNFKLLQTQLNPHFMFNALNEIKLNMNETKIEKSAIYLTSYSKLMRSILEGSTKEFITIKEDVLLISKYLELQQLVHNQRFTFEVKVDDDLDILYLQIPPMLTQPFVENAIIHGVKGILGGKISVNYKHEGDFVKIEIIDNGKGIETKANQSGNSLHNSLGTSIIEKRIKNYDNLYKFKIESKTESDINSGTKVIIGFPLRTYTA
jgi:tetratricopeptide (TPR) repeat protein